MDGLSVDALDMHSLRMVRTLAEHGTITSAAAALGYSQPAVSQHLRRLETRLGVPVVERVGRRVRLTMAGEILARHATSVATALDAARGELDELRGLSSARVRLAGFPSASPTIVPRMLADLARSHPGIRVTYVEEEPPEATAAVQDGNADIALIFSYPGDTADAHRASVRGLAVTDVGRDDLMLVVPEAHPATTAVRSLAAFADERWIAGCVRCRGHLLEACDRAGFAPTIAFETDNIAAVESLVAQGVGVATLPHLALTSFPQLPGIRALRLPTSETRTLHLVTAQGAERVPAVRAVSKALRDAVRRATAVPA